MIKDIIGQDTAVRQLNFQVAAYQASGRLPNLLFSGGSGNGKTFLAEAFVRAMNDAREAKGLDRMPMYSPDSDIGKRQLFEEVFAPSEGADAVYFFDESHLLNDKVAGALLIILDPSKEVVEVEYEGIQYRFDKKEKCFLFATTDTQRLPQAFRNRVHQINVSNYTREQLLEILKFNLGKLEVEIEDEALTYFGDYIRQNGRGALVSAQSLFNLYLINEEKQITLQDVKELIESLAMRRYGLTPFEVEALEILNENGPMQRSTLAHRLSLEVNAVGVEAENYPRALGLLEVNGGREITDKGISYLEEMNPEKDIEESEENSLI